MPFPTTSILDDFSGTLSNWTLSTFGDGALAISAGTCKSAGAGWGGGVWTASFGPDMEAYAKIVTLPGSDDCAVWVRATNTGNSPTGYNLTVKPSTGAWKIMKYVSGTGTQLTSGTQAGVAAGDSFGLSVIGDVVTAYYKSGSGSWVQLGSPQTGSGISGTGKAGLEIYGTTGAWDDFGGGTVSAVGHVSKLLLLGAG